MKRLISFLVSVCLILGLAACSDPRAEFDELAAKAELSLEDGDYALAKAYIDEALAILPDSPVGSEISSRIQSETQSEAILDTVKRQARNSSWEEALSTMESLAMDGSRMEEAKASLQLNFELRLVDYKSLPTEAEAGESLLGTLPLLADAGVNLDQELVDEVYQIALEQANVRLLGAIELSPEDGIKLLNYELTKGFYLIDEFGQLPEQIISKYEIHVVEASKALVRSKDLTGAQRLLTTAASNAPNSDAIKTERARVAELVRLEQAAIKKAEEDAKKRAVNAMYVKEDSFENIKWYYDRATYSSYARDEFLLYMGQRGSGTPWLKLRFMMRDSTWHFFERIVVDVDGTKYELNPGYSGVKRDNGGGDIWEWYTTDPSTRDFQMIEKIIESKSTRIRYINDDNFYEERTVSSAFKRGLSNVLLAYEALGGKR